MVPAIIFRKCQRTTCEEQLANLLRSPNLYYRQIHLRQGRTTFASRTGQGRACWNAPEFQVFSERHRFVENWVWDSSLRNDQLP